MSIPPLNTGYSAAIKERVRKHRSTKLLGVRLAKLAVKNKFSIIRVSRCTGATRMTVYNWYAGKLVSPAYRAQVSKLIDILKTASDSEAAWSEACTAFNLSA